MNAKIILGILTAAGVACYEWIGKTGNPYVKLGNKKGGRKNPTAYWENKK